jgi:hypothetical protein
MLNVMARPLRLLALLPLLLAAGGCAGPSSEEKEEDEFTYGADEMRAQVVGDWSGELTLSGRAATALTLHLEHRPPGVEPACGNRVLGAGLLCSPSSTLGVKGTLTTADGSYSNAPVEGSFSVYGEDMRGGGSLWLELADGVVFDAELSDGVASAGQVSQKNESFEILRPAGSFTLRR